MGMDRWEKWMYEKYVKDALVTDKLRASKVTMLKLTKMKLRWEMEAAFRFILNTFSRLWLCWQPLLCGEHFSTLLSGAIRITRTGPSSPRSINPMYPPNNESTS